MKSLLKRAIGAAGYEVRRLQPRFYDQDGLRSEHDHRFMQDPRFVAAYEAALKTIDNDPQRHGPWRVHVALWVAKNAFRTGGDFVECGVYRGFISSAVMNYLNWNATCGERRFFLFDTFSGFDIKTLTAEEIAAGRMTFGTKYKDTYDAAVKNFGSVPNCVIVKGIVPNSLSTQQISRVSYLHLDMNSAIPEVAALKYFWPYLIDGGLVLMDDYAFVGYEPQHVALGEFAKSVDREIVSLPTGQGLLIK
jgi:hypothetical protein